VRLDPGLKWDVDEEIARRRDPRVPLRFKIRKPRLPWKYAPRPARFQIGINCGNRTIRWAKDPGAQVRAAWLAKNCGPRKSARQFDAGGPEAGTLAGARRVAGLFDEGWGEAFPFTRKEQQALQEGKTVAAPFFAPPVEPHPSSYIEDRLQRLRGKFGPTLFTTPASLARFCPQGGSGITCAGPNAEAVWVAEGRELTAQEKAAFTAAYCAPGVCIDGPKITPPAGVKERFIRVRPRNPAVAVKTSCQPVAQPGPVVTDFPIAPAAPAAAPVTDWSCGATDAGCIGINCVVGTDSRTMRWKQGVPMSVVQGWWAANCGYGT
jgi:hypothetical protein